MPKLIFTQEEVNDYFKGGSSWIFRSDAVCFADEIRVHADGCFPVKLVRERRPNEPKEVLEYREKIWEPITTPKFTKVINSLQKIRRSSEWSIKYEDLAAFSRIADDENLEEYCEKKYPLGFTSLTNWVFAMLLREDMIDPNAIVFIQPLTNDVAINEYVQPFPEIFNSPLIVDFREGDYAVLLNPAGAFYDTEGGKMKGQSYFFVTSQHVWQYDQVTAEQDFRMVNEYNHGLGILPVFKLKGQLVRQADRQFLYKSRIAGIVPNLNEAVRESSDLQAAKVNHIYPERWEYSNNECRDCKGTGRRPNPWWTETCNCEPEIECNKCHGHGYVVAGPYSKMLLKPADPLSPGSVIPSPPAGYIEKDVEVVKLQSESVDAHMFKALAAINFEFLEMTPLNQSGAAKEVDKDELNNTVHSIAEDIVAAMDSIYKITAYYRYKALYSFDDIDEMLPDVAVPQTYDLLSTQHLQDELINSKKSDVNPLILNALEIDYASKRFTDQDIRDMVALCLELDPLPNIAQADKVVMLQNDGITQETYIVSCNILAFIQRALDEEKGFVEKRLPEQKEIIYGYAQEQIDDASQKAAVVKSVFMENGGNGLNDPNGNIQSDPTNNQQGAGQVPPANSGAAGVNDGGNSGTAAAA